MMSKIWAAALGVLLVFPAITAHAAPLEGACCHAFFGCCPGGPVESDARGVSSGACRIETSLSCNGIADSFKGAGTTCEEFCPITTTTTSTTLFTTTTTTTTSTTSTTQPLGACCEPNGTCLDLIEVSCGLATWQGSGTECATTECPQPTTTTVLDTTTTTEEPLLCGDANGDGDIT